MQKFSLLKNQPQPNHYKSNSFQPFHLNKQIPTLTGNSLVRFSYSIATEQYIEQGIIKKFTAVPFKCIQYWWGNQEVILSKTPKSGGYVPLDATSP